MPKPLNTLILIPLLSLFLLTGCLPNIPGIPGLSPPPKPAKADDAGSDDAVELAEPVKPPVSPTPAMRHVPFTAVQFKMPDGLWLGGRLYDPGQKTVPEPDINGVIEAVSAAAGEGGDVVAYKGPRYPLVILLHSVEGSLQDWVTVPKSLVACGYAVLALDLRGHGTSTKTRKNRSIDWRDFEAADWQLLPQDIQQVLLKLQASPMPFPQLDVKHIVIMGAGLGSNVAIQAVGIDSSLPVNPLQPPDRKLPEMLKQIRGIALWSPRMQMKDLDPTLPMLNVQCPVALIGDPQDPLSRDAMVQLAHLAKMPVTSIAKPAGDTLTGALLTDWPDGLKQLLPWLNDRLAVQGKD